MCEMYTYPIDYAGEEANNNPSLWSTQETIEEDKVILETEITLRTGPNITMKIHEESRPSSVISGACESEEDSKRQGIIKVLHDDSESDFYEEMRKSPRTPRKVRFGGESFKLRTPESDSSQQAEENDDDDETSIKITVTDAISIKTRRSLIPVRITSLPSSPKKSSPQQNSNRRLYKSTPNLSNGSSKIPLRRRTMQEVQNQAYLKPNIVESRASSPLPNTSHQFSKKEPDKPPKETSLNPHILKHRRAEDVLSPVPVHEEIEVFHNLTRSPERSKILSAVQRNDEIGADNANRGTLVKSPNNTPEEEASKQSGFDKEEDAQEVVSEAKTYNSFTVCEENNVSLVPKLEENSVIIEDVTEKEKLEASPHGKKSILQQSLSSLTSDDEIWAKSEALESVLKMLREPETCESLEAGPAILVFEALLACHHRDRLHSLADDALTSLIQGLRIKVLEQCLPRVAVSICKMGASAGVRCALTIMKRLPPKKLQLEILSRGLGHRTREGALQILMACARLYPRQDIETSRISEFAASALRDRRRRVRHAALETIAATAQLSSVHETLSIVEATIRDFPDADEIVQVVRTRLSRKQLPSVNLDGSIRYSSPTDQRETDWISGAIIRNNNVFSSPLSSASSSSQSVNYWMHNSKHDDQFNNGSTLIKQVSETYEDDSFDDPAKIWAVHSSTFPKNGKGVNKGPRTNVVRPVYILQPEISSRENGKNGRGYRKYDRGRSISPPKQYKGQCQSGLLEAIPVIPVRKNDHAHFDDDNKNYRNLDVSSRLQYPDHGVFRPHEFRKSFSSDQLYYNDRLQPKHEPYSFSLSSRSSSTSTGSSTRSGFWHRDLRSGIPIPVSETKLKIRHTTSSIVASGGPLIAKRSAVTSPHHTPSSSKPSPRDKTTTIQDNDSISQLSLPPPRSSGSDSSGYFTPSPPENHPPAFIKMESEERLSSDIGEPLDNSVNNNSRDCADSFSAKSVGVESLQAEDNKEANVSTSSSANNNDCLGEVIHDNYSSVESENISNNNEENIKEPGPPSHTNLPPESIPTTIEVRRKSKSVIDLPNFLPKIESKRKSINSAPPRNEEPIVNNNVENNNLETSDKPAPPASHILLPPMDYAVEHQGEIVATNTVTVTKSKVERRFSRRGSRKSLKVSPRVIQETSTNRPASKPKDILQHVLNQLENPNWETTVEGLQGLAKLARQHPEVVEHQIHHVCVLLAKHIKNLRSQVSRVACNTAGELFLSCKRGLDMEMEEISCPLLQRTADTNRFLRADANAALDIMCEQMPPHRVILVITARGCAHQNSIVRAAAVRMLGDMVSRLGADRIFQMPKELRDKVLMAGANALADGNLDARLQGKLLFKHLIDHPNFQRYLHETVPQSLIRHISKVLSSIKSLILSRKSDEMERESTIDTFSTTSSEDQTKPKTAIEKTKLQDNYKSFFRRFCKFSNFKSKKEDSLFRDVEATEGELTESGQTIQNKCFKRISYMERTIPVSYDSIKRSILSEMKQCGRGKLLYDIANGKLTKLTLKQDIRHMSTDTINIAMLWCVFCKNLELLEELVKLGANIRYSEYVQGLAALHIAAFVGSTKITKFLINQNINVNVINKWYNPLHCAAFAKKVETARILLDNGARINSMANGPGYETPLYIAVKADAIDCVKLFIERGAQIYQEGRPGDVSPLFLAAELGRCNCLKIILETNTISCNELRKSENGNTALHIAAEEGHTECIEMLLEHGANPNLTNHRNESPLHLAVKANSYTSVVALIKKGKADPNLEDCDKRTPLHSAVEIVADSRKDIVKVLLSNGANVNAQDQHGFTALHIAALNESSHCVSILIKNEADCSMRTKSGVTAFSLIAKKTPSAVEAIHDRFTDYITLIYQSDSLSDVEMMFDFKNGLQHPKEYLILNAFIDGGHKEILMHPLIMAFLYVTWGRTRRCFFGMIYNSLIFSILLLFYVLTALAYDCDRKINDPAYTNSTIHCNNTSYLNQILRKSPITLKIQWYLLFYFTVSLAYRKIYGFHGYPSLKHYCNNLCNVLEWNNILYVFLISCVYTQSVESWQVYVGAFAVLSAWTNLMFLIGQLPNFGPYFQMFQRVQNEFQKLLIVFFPLILGYTISFCILFPNSPAFPNPLIGLTSALVIMTGDMNYDLLLNYSETEDASNFAKISAQVIYTCFLLQVTVILMNLLVGIVVNDIESLQKNADLSRLERQTKMCSYIEMSHYQRSPLAKGIMVLLRVVPKPYIPILKVKSMDPKESKHLNEIVQAAYSLAKKRETEKKNVFNRNRDESRAWRRLTIGSLKEGNIYDFKWTSCLSQVMCNLSNQNHQIKTVRHEIVELKDVIKSGFSVSPIREEVYFYEDDDKLKSRSSNDFQTSGIN